MYSNNYDQMNENARNEGEKDNGLKRISTEVANYLKRKKLTHKRIAAELGIGEQTVAKQLAGIVPFSVKMARKYADAYGLRMEFLLTGSGPLLDKDTFGSYTREVDSEWINLPKDPIRAVEYLKICFYAERSTRINLENEIELIKQNFPEVKEFLDKQKSKSDDVQ